MYLVALLPRMMSSLACSGLALRSEAPEAQRIVNITVSLLHDAEATHDAILQLPKHRTTDRGDLGALASCAAKETGKGPWHLSKLLDPLLVRDLLMSPSMSARGRSHGPAA